MNLKKNHLDNHNNRKISYVSIEKKINNDKNLLELEKIKNENEKLKKEIEELKNNEKYKILENEEIKNNINQPINNKLINIIIDKTKTIDDLKNKINDENSVIKYNEIKNSLFLNNCKIIPRCPDNYINAIELCNIENKKFDDWYSLDTSKHFSEWIRNSFIKDFTIDLIKDKNNKITLKDQKITFLENILVKKQKRKIFSEKNVVYIITTVDNKNNRIYIIGKSINLKIDQVHIIKHLNMKLFIIKVLKVKYL